VAGPDNDSSVVAEFRGVPIAELIGRPMVAIVKANEMMAKEQVKLLMKICFSRIGDTYEPVMITMSISRGVIEPGDGEGPAEILQLVTTFQVPLITLIPINSLAIENADIEFDMDVQSQYEFIEDRGDGPFGADSSSPTKTSELTGSISYDSRSKTEEWKADESRSTQLSVNVSAGTLPLPLGVSTILQAYSQSIYPSDNPQDQTNKCER
jgi:uncharacterized protein DUF2589